MDWRDRPDPSEREWWLHLQVSVLGVLILAILLAPVVRRIPHLW